MAYVVGIAGNLAVIPQLIKAWQSSAPGMSVLTWVFFIVTASVWLVYGIRHKQKPLIVSTTASIIFNFLIVAGWLYNNKIK